MSPKARRRLDLAGVAVVAGTFGAGWGSDQQPARGILFGIAAVAYVGVIVGPRIARARAAAAAGVRLRRPGVRQWATLVGGVVVVLLAGRLADEERAAIWTLLVGVASSLLILLGYWLTPRPPADAVSD